jgi:hypothetical protein
MDRPMCTKGCVDCVGLWRLLPAVLPEYQIYRSIMCYLLGAMTEIFFSILALFSARYCRGAISSLYGG